MDTHDNFAAFLVKTIIIVNLSLDLAMLREIETSRGGGGRGLPYKEDGGALLKF